MSSSRKARGGRPAYNAPPKGLFANGVWSCDCNPRQPAVHFETKKPGPNKGRWFYACQKPQSDSTRCKFFLWDDDARPREERALLNNSRTEPAHTNPVTPSKPRNVPEPPPPYTPVTEPPRKRNRSAVEQDDELAFELEDDTVFEAQLDQIFAADETPSKAARTETYTTPARRRLPWAKADNESAHGLQTPQTERHAPPTDTFPTRFAAPGGSMLTPARFKEHEVDTRRPLASASSPFNTPTPSRFKDVGPAGAKDDLVQDVFNLLQEDSINLGSATETQLRNILSKHVRKAEGFRRGQELVRLAVKTKEAKIAELEYRIAMLESGQDTEHAEHSDS